MKKLPAITLCVFILFGVLASCKKGKDKDTTPSENVVYQTDFSSDDGNWPLGKFSDGIGSSQILNGYYQLTNNSTNSTHNVYTGFSFGNNVTNCAIEASIILTKINPSDNFAGGGLLWNDNVSTHSRFRFTIYTDGIFGVYGTLTNGNMETYKEMSSNAIRIGQSNVLRIELKSDLLHFLINGTEVYSMKPVYDNSLDHCGFTIPGPAILKADYFKAIKL